MKSNLFEWEPVCLFTYLGPINFTEGTYFIGFFNYIYRPRLGRNPIWPSWEFLIYSLHSASGGGDKSGPLKQTHGLKFDWIGLTFQFNKRKIWLSFRGNKIIFYGMAFYEQKEGIYKCFFVSINYMLYYNTICI